MSWGDRVSQPSAPDGSLLTIEAQYSPAGGESKAGCYSATILGGNCSSGSGAGSVSSTSISVLSCAVWTAKLGRLCGRAFGGSTPSRARLRTRGRSRALIEPVNFMKLSTAVLRPAPSRLPCLASREWRMVTDAERERLFARLAGIHNRRRRHVDEAFGDDIDYAMPVKLYGATADPEHRYSAA